MRFSRLQSMLLGSVLLSTTAALPAHSMTPAGEQVVAMRPGALLVGFMEPHAGGLDTLAQAGLSAPGWRSPATRWTSSTGRRTRRTASRCPTR